MNLSLEKYQEIVESAVDEFIESIGFNFESIVKYVYGPNHSFSDYDSIENITNFIIDYLVRDIEEENVAKANIDKYFRKLGKTKTYVPDNIKDSIKDIITHIDGDTIITQYITRCVEKGDWVSACYWFTVFMEDIFLYEAVENYFLRYNYTLERLEDIVYNNKGLHESKGLKESNRKSVWKYNNTLRRNN